MICLLYLSRSRERSSPQRRVSDRQKREQLNSARLPCSTLNFAFPLFLSRSPLPLSPNSLSVKSQLDAWRGENKDEPRSRGFTSPAQRVGENVVDSRCNGLENSQKPVPHFRLGVRSVIKSSNAIHRGRAGHFPLPR